MRKDEYRKHLDKITCTDEFRSRMEDILSTDADGEYADSVSTVERAGKINYHRWAGIAASAVLMVGIGGVMLQTMKNAPDVPGSSLSETTATTERIFMKNMMKILPKKNWAYFMYSTLPVQGQRSLFTA